MEEVTEIPGKSTANVQEDNRSEVERPVAIETEIEEESVAEENEVEDLSAAELQQILRFEKETQPSAGAGQFLEQIVVKADGRYTSISCWLSDTEEYTYRKDECRMLIGRQAKFRLLQAIGSCMTLRKIELQDLSGDELDALLTPLQSNRVLECISIDCPTEAELAYATHKPADSEEVCEILGKILLNTVTLTCLMLNLSELTTAGARHLALGLRRNAESALEDLYLHKLQESGVVKQVAEIILSAPKLRKLGLWDIANLDGDSIFALTHALTQRTSLKWLGLRIRSVASGTSALLLRKALNEERSNRSITTLVLYGALKGIGDFLLQYFKSLEELLWDSRQEGLGPDQWWSLGRSLISNSSLKQFRILVPWNSFGREGTDGVEALLSAVAMEELCVGLYLNSRLSEDPNSCPWHSSSEWRDEEAQELLREANVKKPIVELHLILQDLGDVTTVWSRLARALRSKVTPLCSLYLQMSPQLLGATGRVEQVDSFFQALREKSSLRLLTVDGGNGEYWHERWKKLLDCLHDNTSISHLRLINCSDLDDDVFKQFLGIIRGKSTLKKIRLLGTSWMTDGKKELIEEALRRKAEEESRFSILRKQGLQFHPATKHGHLILCGSPGAGKSTLRQTMTRTRNPRGTCYSWWLRAKGAQISSWSRRDRRRDREVELFKIDQEMQIAILDVGRRWFFSTRIGDIGSLLGMSHTSIFLYVFSPYDRENRCIKEDLERCFKTELEEWLPVIANKCQITGPRLPKVLVVFSNMDQIKGRDVSWAESILTELRERYERVLDISNIDEVCKVDTRKTREVTCLLDFILGIFRIMLQDNNLMAPKVCRQINSRLSKRLKEIKHRPVWSTKDFCHFLADCLRGHVHEPMRPETSSGLEVIEAMVGHLHYTGSIITIPTLDKIIVDPIFFTNIFLREMNGTGNDFHLNSNRAQKLELVPFSSNFSFISFLAMYPGLTELNLSSLKQLFIHFDLCRKLDHGAGSARYMLTTTEPDNNGGTRIESLSWCSLPESNQQFIGFRMQCESPTTLSMTAELYSHFQIHIQLKLSATKKNQTEYNVINSRNCMHLLMDGLEIIIERSDTVTSHIDVMVKYSKYWSRETAVQFILNELYTFCAFAAALVCPGIALEVGILRTECVKYLIPMTSRGEDQAIQIRKLKNNFEAYILEQVDVTNPESCSVNIDYQHQWPPIPGYLPGNFVLATKLLPESDVQSVLKEVRKKHGQQLKTLKTIKRQQLKLLDQISEELNDEIAPDVGDPCSPSTDTWGPSCTCQPTVGRELSQIDRLERTMCERFDRMEVALKRVEKDMDEIITLQQQLQSSLSMSEHD